MIYNEKKTLIKAVCSETNSLQPNNQTFLWWELSVILNVYMRSNAKQIFYESALRWLSNWGYVNKIELKYFGRFKQPNKNTDLDRTDRGNSSGLNAVLQFLIISCSFPLEPFCPAVWVSEPKPLFPINQAVLITEPSSRCSREQISVGGTNFIFPESQLELKNKNSWFSCCLKAFQKRSFSRTKWKSSFSPHSIICLTQFF